MRTHSTLVAALVLTAAGLVQAQVPPEEAPPAAEPPKKEPLPRNEGAEPPLEAVQAEPGDTPPPEAEAEGQELPPPEEDAQPEEAPQAETEAAPVAETAPAVVPLGDEEEAAAAAPPQQADAAEETTTYESEEEAMAPSSGGYEDATLEEGLVTPEPSGPRFILGLWWDVNYPLGPSRDFVKKVDPAGFQVEGRFRGLADFGAARLGAGFAVAWHSMEEKTRSSIESDNATITGTQVRDLGATSLLAKMTLAVGELEQVAPYVGLGIGPSRVLRRLDIGIYRVTDESWHFALEPELGVELPVGPVLGLAAVRFNYFVGNSDAPEQMYLNFSVGAGFN